MISLKAKQIIAQVFLFAFVFIKASGLHAFVHDHGSVYETDKCVLCQISSRDNLTPAIHLENDVDLHHFVQIHYTKINTLYTPLFSKQPAVCDLFNKPPPADTVL